MRPRIRAAAFEEFNDYENGIGAARRGHFYNMMMSLAKRLDRLEHAFGLLREREKELDFAQLDQLLPEERRAKIVQLSVQIAERRGSRRCPASGSKMLSCAR